MEKAILLNRLNTIFQTYPSGIYVSLIEEERSDLTYGNALLEMLIKELENEE